MVAFVLQQPVEVVRRGNGEPVGGWTDFTAPTFKAIAPNSGLLLLNFFSCFFLSFVQTILKGALTLT